MSLFEIVLSVPLEDIEVELKGCPPIPWADFFLNPRRLRGSDFLMRWSQGVWSEERLIHAVNETGKYFALPYGPSGTAPDDDIHAFELYFERLEQAGLGGMKRPDLLVFRKADDVDVKKAIRKLGGLLELPFTPEDNADMKELLSLAILAVECENSLWRAALMPDFGAALRPQRRLGGKPGLKKSAVLPTVILKEEDRVPLLEWQEDRGVKVHIWHAFYDMAFGLSLDKAEDLIQAGLVEPTRQTFQAPGGAITKKIIYKIYYHYAYPLGTLLEEPQLVADYITDRNGHILPYVRFEGGKLELRPEAIQVLDQAAGSTWGHHHETV
ncbi:MAG: AccI family restriction endonuclease [Clostridia bacterium]|nr:MAG: AccI family restriction endonuclease [Clostridia bacterium]